MPLRRCSALFHLPWGCERDPVRSPSCEAIRPRQIFPVPALLSPGPCQSERGRMGSRDPPRGQDQSAAWRRALPHGTVPKATQGNVATHVQTTSGADASGRDAGRGSLRTRRRTLADTRSQIEGQNRVLVMTDKLPDLRADTGGTEITRFNALKHGVLSRYTVLPWEASHEYDHLVDALVSEHQPQGPTEEHLVEELAGIMWRKRRLRLAEAAAYRRGLGRAVDRNPNTAKAAVAHMDDADLTEGVGEAVRATQTDTQQDFRE